MRASPSDHQRASHSDFGPLTDSDWSKLTPDQQAEALRQQSAEVIRRHRELIEGQKTIGGRIDSHGASIEAAAVQLQDMGARVDVIAGALAQNTEVTLVVRADVHDVKQGAADMREDVSGLKTDVAAIKADTTDIVKVGKSIKGTLEFFEWTTKFALKVGGPLLLLYGGYRAVADWLVLQPWWRL